MNFYLQFVLLLLLLSSSLLLFFFLFLTHRKSVLIASMHLNQCQYQSVHTLYFIWVFHFRYSPLPSSLCSVETIYFSVSSHISFLLICQKMYQKLSKRKNGRKEREKDILYVCLHLCTWLNDMDSLSSSHSYSRLLSVLLKYKANKMKFFFFSSFVRFFSTPRNMRNNILAFLLRRVMNTVCSFGSFFPIRSPFISFRLLLSQIQRESE